MKSPPSHISAECCKVASEISSRYSSTLMNDSAFSKTAFEVDANGEFIRDEGPGLIATGAGIGGMGALIGSGRFKSRAKKLTEMMANKSVGKVTSNFNLAKKLRFAKRMRNSLGALGLLGLGTFGASAMLES
ncbi:MAG: hypothetical protein KKF39_07000 [Nanoarchaeota archaeon]|nr:hypothetical protein [Nanoarchaeota archaeon]